MPPGSPQRIDVKGFREFVRACDKAKGDIRKETRASFRKVGDIVRAEARTKLGELSPRSPKTEQGYRTIVRQRGVSVEQTKRKTTGKRPDWGATQMERALVPALLEKEDEVAREFNEALDKVAERFAR